MKIQSIHLDRLTDQSYLPTITKDSPLGAQRKYYKRKSTKVGERGLYTYME